MDLLHVGSLDHLEMWDKHSPEIQKIRQPDEITINI